MFEYVNVLPIQKIKLRNTKAGRKRITPQTRVAKREPFFPFSQPPGRGGWTGGGGEGVLEQGKAGQAASQVLKKASCQDWDALAHRLLWLLTRPFPKLRHTHVVWGILSLRKCKHFHTLPQNDKIAP